jgi:hypothetical protein
MWASSLASASASFFLKAATYNCGGSAHVTTHDA